MGKTKFSTDYIKLHFHGSYNPIYVCKAHIVTIVDKGGAHGCDLYTLDGKGVNVAESIGTILYNMSQKV